jgi:hypothetical protein
MEFIGGATRVCIQHNTNNIIDNTNNIIDNLQDQEEELLRIFANIRI